jgi:hypothetical protein
MMARYDPVPNQKGDLMSLVHRMVRAALSALAVLMIFYPFSAVSASAPEGVGQPTPNPAKSIPPQTAGNPHVLRRVFTAGVLDLAVVQQPAGQSMYVSDGPDQATQFRLASRYGNVGLLAHDFLAGSYFSQLVVGMKVHLAYSDGQVESYVVSQVLRFEALRPDSTYSSFRDLDNGQTLSASRLFLRVYGGTQHLTFQTCIPNNGDLNWGRLFVIAVPVAESKQDLH